MDTPITLMGTGGVFMGNRRYDPDFKREAVRMVVEDGLSIREVEREPWRHHVRCVRAC